MISGKLVLLESVYAFNKRLSKSLYDARSPYQVTKATKSANTAESCKRHAYKVGAKLGLIKVIFRYLYYKGSVAYTRILTDKNLSKLLTTPRAALDKIGELFSVLKRLGSNLNRAIYL